jgi:hypothetical protein
MIHTLKKAELVLNLLSIQHFPALSCLHFFRIFAFSASSPAEIIYS